MKYLLLIATAALLVGCDNDKYEVVTDGNEYAVKGPNGKIVATRKTCEQAQSLKKALEEPFDYDAYKRERAELSKRNWKRADCQ